MSCFTSQHLSWKQDTRLALHHSFSSWKHNTSLISSSCFNSQPSGWKQDTRLALRHNFSSWKHSTNLISSSCFTSQASGWKQDTTLGLRHNCQAGSTVLVSSHLFVLRHNNEAGSKRCLITTTTPPFEEGPFGLYQAYL
jgi:hypothetical protein